jgi:hypothetical protein
LSRQGLVSKGRTREECQGDKEFKVVTVGFFVFARDLFNCIRRSEESGSLVPGKILTRSLFEGVVNLLYIETNSQSLAHRFLTHQAAQRYGRLLLSRELGLDDPPEAGDIEAEWKKVKNDNGKGKNKDKPQPYWHGMNMRELCQRLEARNAAYAKLREDYLVYYKEDSDFVHASVEAIASYIRVGGPGKPLQFHPEPSPAERVKLLARCSQWMLWMLAAAHGFLCLGPPRGARELQREIEGLASDP